MGQADIQHQILDDLRKLPARLQLQIQELVHAMVTSMSTRVSQHELLRFEVDNPLTPPGTYPADSEFSVSADAEPDTIMNMIRDLITEGQILQARRLAAEGAERFPEYEELRKARRILSGGGSSVSSGPPAPRMNEELEWLSRPPDWARGKWVALIGKEAVAVSENLAELAASVRQMNLPREPLVHRID